MKYFFMPMLVVFFSCKAFAEHFLTTLHDIQNYAHAYPENVISSNDDWANPRYAHFYDKYRPTLFSKLQHFLGFSHKPFFDGGEFKNLMTRLQRKQLATKDGTFVLPLKTGDKCIIWGDIHGAFHSLARSLQELKYLGIIDEQLVIINKSYHFIFLGDIVNRSPYSLETLMIVLRLMEKNPEQVIYLRGSEESNHFWENFTMRFELQEYAQSFAEKSDGITPLKTIINSFFDALPRVIKLCKKNSNDSSIVACMHNATQLKEGVLDSIKAIIYGEGYSNIDPFKIRYGLEYLGFSQGIAEWTIMSCPVELYQKFFNFYYDAFVMFEFGDSIETSVITLYNHDVRENNKHFETTSYGLIFGEKIGKKEEERASFNAQHVFSFGSTMDLKSVASSLGTNIKTGIDFLVREQNIHGGIDNLFLKPIFINDSYDPRMAYKNIESLLHGLNINIFLAPVGTATLLLSLDKIKKGEIAVLFPITGYPLFRNSELKNMLHFRASYADEACALIDYIITSYGSKKFAFFYQDDAYGRSSLEAAHAELKKYNLKSVIDIPYLRDQTSFKEEAEILKKTNADAIGLLSASLSTQIFLDEVGIEYLKNKHIFAMSFLESEDLKKFLADKGIKQTFSFVVPNPTTSNLPIVKEYRAAMQKYGLRTDANSLEGWIVMRLLLDALHHISAPFTAEKIIAHFESFKNYDLGGLKLTFDQTTRSFDLPVLIQNEDGVLIEYKSCKAVENPADRKFLV